jgi:hypothetical protein
MKTFSTLLPALIVCADICWAVRCTTTFDARALLEYESYVNIAERAMVSRVAASELSWVKDSARQEAVKALQLGDTVRRNISSPATNERIADWNGAVIDWIGAIRIRGTSIDDLKELLRDYSRYTSIYSPMIYECRAQPAAVPAGAADDVVFGLQNVYRFASVFPQRWLFRVKSRSDYSESGAKSDPVLIVHSRATEIRESESGVPGRNDFLERYRDHGILWALNTYWLARQKGPDLYVEFEAITLARSIRNFKCRIGIVPVPKSIVSGVMDSLPGDSVGLMLAATKAECERRIAQRPVKVIR